MSISFAHTNLVAEDWRRLAQFYQQVFDCRPVPPERDLQGAWIDRATGIPNTRIRGIHLRLPGCGQDGPTLEIFEYDRMPDHPPVRTDLPGFSHIAFAVDDVAAVTRQVFEHGGAPVGELTLREVPGVGRLTFQYVADPEGNILEIQNWRKVPGPS